MVVQTITKVFHKRIYVYHTDKLKHWLGSALIATKAGIVLKAGWAFLNKGLWVDRVIPKAYDKLDNRILYLAPKIIPMASLKNILRRLASSKQNVNLGKVTPHCVWPSLNIHYCLTGLSAQFLQGKEMENVNVSILQRRR